MPLINPKKKENKKGYENSGVLLLTHSPSSNRSPKYKWIIISTFIHMYTCRFWLPKKNTTSGLKIPTAVWKARYICHSLCNKLSKASKHYIKHCKKIAGEIDYRLNLSAQCPLKGPNKWTITQEKEECLILVKYVEEYMIVTYLMVRLICLVNYNTI
jgi:hypothetical protein